VTDVVRALGRRYARLATNLVVRRPQLWRVLRKPLRLQFDRLAPRWDTMQRAGGLGALEAALDSLADSPRRVLDLGCGTGNATFLVARRFPEAEVVGVDLSPGMVAEARRKTPPDLGERVRFDVADASALPFGDGEFELVVLANMIPFFDELARITAPGGAVVSSASGGAGTPIYVPPERLRAGLAAHGFAEFANFSAGVATAVLARKAEAR
jgi:SAM-dependent methyltransferase